MIELRQTAYAKARSTTEKILLSPSQLLRAGFNVTQDGQRKSVFSLLGQADIDTNKLAEVVTELKDISSVFGLPQ